MQRYLSTQNSFHQLNTAFTGLRYWELMVNKIQENSRLHDVLEPVFNNTNSDKPTSDFFSFVSCVQFTIFLGIRFCEGHCFWILQCGNVRPSIDAGSWHHCFFWSTHVRGNCFYSVRRPTYNEWFWLWWKQRLILPLDHWRHSILLFSHCSNLCLSKITFRAAIRRHQPHKSQH